MMKRVNICGWILLLAIATVSVPAFAEDRKANELLQSGVMKETLGGDLDAAIGLYQQALKEAGGNRSLAAKAQLRLGAAYQNQGNPQARSVFESLVRDYADQREPAGQAQTRLAALVAAIGPAGAAQAPALETLNLKVDISTYRGDAKTGTQSHILEVQTNGKTAQVRSGSEVPITGQTRMQQVGTQVDCQATPAVDGRYQLSITITNRIVAEGQSQSIQSAPGIPSFRNFIVATPLLLAPGESARFSGVDLVTNETVQADVTLSVKR